MTFSEFKAWLAGFNYGRDFKKHGLTGEDYKVLLAVLDEVVVPISTTVPDPILTVTTAPHTYPLPPMSEQWCDKIHWTCKNTKT